MKTIFKSTLIIISSLLLLSSCTDVVQIKLDQGSKLYVIDGFVNNLRTPQTIRVLTNDSYFSNSDAPPVPNASVVLTDVNTNTQYIFNYTDKGNYVYNPNTLDTISKTNHQYSLSVTIDGFAYTSLITQKRAALIDSVYTVYEDGQGGFGGGNKPYYRCELAAKDKADKIPDYYWIKTFRNDTLFSGAGDMNLAIDGTGGEVTDFPLDSESFTPVATLLSFKKYQPGNTCKVEIHSITRETYNFLNQAVAQINNGGLFAITPENVKSNIVTPAGAKTKAIGWFSMATVAVSKTKVVP